MTSKAEDLLHELIDSSKFAVALKERTGEAPWPDAFREIQSYLVQTNTLSDQKGKLHTAVLDNYLAWRAQVAAFVHGAEFEATLTNATGESAWNLLGQVARHLVDIGATDPSAIPGAVVDDYLVWRSEAVRLFEDPGFRRSMAFTACDVLRLGRHEAHAVETGTGEENLQDAVQDVCHTILEDLTKVRHEHVKGDDPRLTLLGYCEGAFRTILKRTMRGQSKLVELGDEATGNHPYAWSRAGMEIDQRNLIGEIVEGTHLPSETQRHVLERRAQDASNEEIAEATGKSKSSIENFYSRALKATRANPDFYDRFEEAVMVDKAYAADDDDRTVSLHLIDENMSLASIQARFKFLHWSGNSLTGKLQLPPNAADELHGFATLGATTEQEFTVDVVLRRAGEYHEFSSKIPDRAGMGDVVDCPPSMIRFACYAVG